MQIVKKGAPFKTGVDYFYLDNNLDEKFEMIESFYGSIGFTVIIKLYQKIYSDKGYYWEYDLKRLKLLQSKIKTLQYIDGEIKLSIIEFDLLEKIIDDACDFDIFSKPLFDKYKILTSSGIQKRYLKVVQYRTGIEMVKPWVLINDIPDNIKLINFSNKIKEDPESTKDKEPIKPQNNRFKPPTYEEIKAYCKEKNWKINIQKFIDFYQSKGWMVGKNKMKDWKSAVSNARNWDINKNQNDKSSEIRESWIEDAADKYNLMRGDSEYSGLTDEAIFSRMRMGEYSNKPEIINELEKRIKKIGTEHIEDIS